MLKKIYEEILKYDTIVIARHIGVDPDALGSQFALKTAININFPLKKVFVVGSKSSRYNYFPKLDKYEEINNSEVLLIVCDTPDKKRVDISNFDTFPNICKIDHHPLIDKFSDYEYIDTSASSASELVLTLLIVMSFSTKNFKTNSDALDDKVSIYSNSLNLSIKG